MLSQASVVDDATTAEAAASRLARRAIASNTMSLFLARDDTGHLQPWAK